MPPLRPPTPLSDEEASSESDAPESISLIQSKKSIRRQDADIRRVEATVREKVRLRNRERDRKLKERAEVGRRGRGEEEEFVVGLGKGKGRELRKEGEGEDGVEARMLRAMKDAGDEGSDSEDGGEFEEGSSFDSSSMDEDDIEYQGEDDDDDDDDEMSADEVDPTSANSAPLPPSNRNNYLPDELFQAAFSQQTNKPKKNDSKSTKKVVSKNDKRRSKKASSSSKPKDILVGSRTIRTFQSSKSQPVPSTANPSVKVNRFLDRALGLKSQKKSLSRKGWERKPANIGILRRNGPAAHFVRNQ